MGLLRLWGETIVGIFRTAPGEHIEMFRQDGGFALRMMRKNKGFTALVKGVHSGDGNRSEHCNFQRGQWSAVAAAALYQRRSPGND